MKSYAWVSEYGIREIGLSVKVWAWYGKIVRSVIWNSKNKNLVTSLRFEWTHLSGHIAGIRDSWIKIWGNTYDLCRMSYELTE